MKILAVDDDPIFLQILTDVLTEAGYPSITTAASAAEALGVLSATQHAFDCLLLDIRMPGMDGIELCREIRSLPDHMHTPIIMLTMLTDDASIEQAFEAGANDYVTKPLQGLELGSRIRLAAQMSDLRERNRKLLQSRVLAGCPSTGSLHAGRPAMIAMSDIAGVVNYLELENYLLRMGEGVFAMRMFALAISDFEAELQTAGDVDRNELLGDLAGEISQVLNTPKSLIASPGDGVLVFIMKGWHRVSISAVETAVRGVFETWFGAAAADRIGFHIQWDREKNLVVCTGQRAADRLRNLVLKTTGELENLSRQRRLRAMREDPAHPHPFTTFFRDASNIRPRRIARPSA